MSEIRSQRLYALVNTSFDKEILDLSNSTLTLEDIDTLKYILDRTSITHWAELDLSNSSIDDAGCRQLCKVFNDNDIVFNRISLTGNQLTIDSLEAIANILICCKTQALYLPDNFNVNSNTTLMHLVMEYVFRQRALKYSLIINSCNQENVIFNRLDVTTIVAHLYSRKTITGIHFFHRKMNDEIAIALSVIITKQKMPCEICLWNSHVSSNVIQHILSLMLQKVENQLLFVYESSPLVNSDTAIYHFDKGKSSVLTFIYLSEFRLVLHGIHSINNTFMSFLNTIFNLKVGTFTEIQLSNIKITEDNVSSFSQIFSRCRMLSRWTLSNNILESHLLKQLINSVNCSSSLSQIIIEDNNMTFSDCCAIADELVSNHLHTVTIFYNNTLRVYRSHDEQLSNSNAIISTIMKLHEINYIVVCEKYLITESVSFIHEACRSLPISYIFLCKTILFAKKIKRSQIFLMMLNYSFPTSSITEVTLSNCELNAELTQLLTRTLSHCKYLTKITSDSNNFKSPELSLSFFIISLIELPSMRQFVAYERKLRMNDIDKINRTLIMKNKNLCVTIVTNDKLIGYKINSISFNEALNLNLTITDVWLLFCNIDQYILETVGKVSHIKRITVLHGRMESQLFFDSNCIELEELCIFNNLLQLEAIYIAKALQKISSITVLRLENNSIPEGAATTLAAAIRVNSCLRKLSLSANRLGSSTVVVVNALKEISTLKELDLNDNKNRSEGLGPAIATVVSTNKSLETLSVKDNGLNDDGVILIAQSLCELSSLKVCNLRDNYITNKAAKALASAISKNTKLEELYLGNNQLQLGTIKIAISLQKISTLKVLDLDNNNITEQAAKQLSIAIKKNTSLENLWLNGNHLRSSVVMVVNALKKVSTLKELNINDNKSRSKELAPAIASVVTKNKLIQKLLLKGNGLDDDGMILIAQSLCRLSSLKVYNLQDNNVTERSAEALASVISSNTGLEELYFGNNYINLGIGKIAVSLQKISALKKLNLDNNNITEHVAKQLSGAIRSNISLDGIWLSDNCLGSSTAIVVNALKGLSTLKILDLNNNKNRSKELAPAIASVVSKNKSLKILSLSGNNLGDDGIATIARSLCKHVRLKILCLQNNNMTEKSAESLASVISSNTKLKELYLGNNNLQLGTIKIAISLQTISTLKVLDLTNNSMTEQVTKELSVAIGNNPSLENICLRGNCLGSSAIMIVSVLKKLSTIKVLDLSDNRSGELSSVVASAIARNKAIERLMLGNNNLNDCSIILISLSLCRLNSLKICNLQNNNITEGAAEAVSSIISGNTGLEELYLGSNQIQSGVVKIANNLQKLCSLKVLDLDNNNITEQVTYDLSIAIRNNVLLEKLWLNGNHLGSSTVLVVNALKEISTLKELDLNDNLNRSTELASAIASVITRNTLIERLSLSGNNLNDDGVIRIARSLYKLSGLRIFDLEDNNITEESADALAAVISNNTKLEELYLGNNQLQLGTIKIAISLQKVSTLKVLDLDNNSITERAAKQLSIAIKKNISLQVLLLSGNHLASSTVVVVNALKEISTLKVLALNDNLNSSKELAPAVASVITKNKSIERLLLGSNNLNDEGVREISKPLCKHYNLKAINLQNNNITEGAAELLASVISSNTGLEELCLGCNQLALGTIKIATALKNLAALKHSDLHSNNMLNK